MMWKEASCLCSSTVENRRNSLRVTTVSVSPVTSYNTHSIQFQPHIWDPARRTCCSTSWKSHCRALWWDKHTQCCRESWCWCWCWCWGRWRGRWPIRGEVSTQRVLIEPFCHSPGEKERSRATVGAETTMLSLEWRRASQVADWMRLK